MEQRGGAQSGVCAVDGVGGRVRLQGNVITLKAAVCCAQCGKPCKVSVASLSDDSKLSCHVHSKVMLLQRTFHVFHPNCLVDCRCVTEAGNNPELRFSEVVQTRIGIDIGGVLCPAGRGQEDTLLHGDCTRVAPTKNAIEVTKKIVDKFGASNVFIVSKAGTKVSRRSSIWLEHIKWYELTGMLRENVRFVAERRDKAPLCEELKIDCFIDDNLPVLRYFRHSASLILFGQPDEDDFADAFFYQPNVSTCADFLELEKKLILGEAKE